MAKTSYAGFLKLANQRKKLQEDDPGWLKQHGMTAEQARQARLRRYGRSKPGANGQYRPT